MMDTAGGIDRIEQNDDIHLWLIMLFGPFYIGYKGYIKEAILLASFAVVAPVIIVDFGIDPGSDKAGVYLTMAVNGIAFFLTALAFSKYLNTSLAKLWKLNLRFPSLGILMVGIFLLSITYLEVEIVNFHYENQLKNAVEAQKDGKNRLGDFFKLCRKGLGDACFYAGMNLSEAAEDSPGTLKKEWEASALRYFKSGCGLDSARSCHALAIMLESDKDIELRERSLKRACELGWHRACEELKKENKK